jgi:hypothetical protein
MGFDLRFTDKEITAWGGNLCSRGGAVPTVSSMGK